LKKKKLAQINERGKESHKFFIKDIEIPLAVHIISSHTIFYFETHKRLSRRSMAFTNYNYPSFYPSKDNKQSTFTSPKSNQISVFGSQFDHRLNQVSSINMKFHLNE
jgi:hypothetical protein